MQDIHPLCEYRLRNGGFTQDTFADRIGWSSSAVKQVESRKISAGNRLVVRLAEKLDITLPEAWALVGGPDNARPKGLSIVGRVAARGAEKNSTADSRSRVRRRRPPAIH